MADLRGKLNQTAIQRKFLMEQSYKMKEQEQELNEMARMKEQLHMGRAITNLDLYRSLIFKTVLHCLGKICQLLILLSDNKVSVVDPSVTLSRVDKFFLKKAR